MSASLNLIKKLTTTRVIFYRRVITCFLIFIITLPGLTGCALNISDRKDKLISTNQVILFVPEHISGQPLDLVYIITPGGTPAEAKTYIGYWRELSITNNYLLAAPLEWDQEVLWDVLEKIERNYQIRSTIITGLSNGGYNSCYLGLAGREGVDAIIPMGAYCRGADVSSNYNYDIAILAVVGENDTWAKGEDGGNIEAASQELAGYGLMQEILYVPDLGHAFPVQAMADIAKWLNDKVKN